MTDAQQVDRTTSAAEVRTFLIADVRGYTQFTLDHGDALAAALAGKFARVSTEVVSTRDGKVIELRGDEVLAVFSSSRQALHAAVDLQTRFAEELVADPTLPLHVGVGLDAGEAVPVDGGYRGAALNLAARLCSLAGPGEVLASETVTNIARKLDGLEYRDRGSAVLKGFAAPVRIVQVAQEVASDAELVGLVELPMPIGGFLGALPAGPIVAREAELAQVHDAIQAVAGGSGRLILLAGEPGAGKTRLSQEIMLEARNRGFRVATGVSYEGRQGVPYYPFVDALGALYGAAPPDIRSSAQQRWSYLGRLLPEAGFPLVGASSDGDQEQERLFRAITGFVQALAQRSPIALLLDDLHWADASSLDLLQHLARQTRAFPVLIVGTYRDVEVGRQHPLEQALLDLTREQLIDRIAVRRLGPEGTAALIGATFGEEDVSEEFTQLVHRHTEGNAFFTQEVLRAMVERGDVFRSADGWDRREVEEIHVPESVRSVIGQRLSRLSAGSQELLTEASVLGQAFDFDDLMAMSDRLEEEVERALDEGIAAGLIREADRDRYAFNHALTQQALYGELSSRRRRRLHLAAGDAIERLPELKRQKRIGELAWHFFEGDDPAKALRYALLAGDTAAAVFARAEAIQHFQRALELARETEDRSSIAEALFKLGHEELESGNHGAALPLFEEAADLCAELNESVKEGWALVMANLIHNNRGNEERAQLEEERVMRLLDRIADQPPSRDKALFYHELGGHFLLRGRHQKSVEAANLAVDVAEALGNGALLTRMELQRAERLAIAGNVRAAIWAAEAVIPRVEAAGDLETLEEALNDAAEYSMLAGELDRSFAYRQRERDVDERLGTLFMQIFVLVNIAQLESYRGNWSSARDHAERALSWGEEAKIGFPTRVARWQLGSLAMNTGDWERASQLLEQAAGERAGSVQVQKYVMRDLALLDILQGRPERALGRLQDHVARGEGMDNDTLLLLPILAWAEMELGDLEGALTHASEAVSVARERENALALADALRVHGMALARLGRYQEATDSFMEAVALTQRMGYPLAEARAYHEWGRLDAVRGDLDSTRTHLGRAREIAQRLGAAGDVEQVDRDLATLGVE